MSEPVAMTVAERQVLAAYGRKAKLAAIAATQDVDEVWAQSVVDRFAAGDHLAAREVARTAVVVADPPSLPDGSQPLVVEPAVLVAGDEEEVAAVLPDPTVTAPVLDPATYSWPDTAEQLNLNEVISLAYASGVLDVDALQLAVEIVRKGMELATRLRDRQRVAERVPDLSAAVVGKWRAECDTRCAELGDEARLGEHARAWAQREGRDCPGTGTTPAGVVVAYLETLLEATNGD